MSVYFGLQMTALMMSNGNKPLPNPEDNPMLIQILDSLGYDHDRINEAPELLKERFDNLVDALDHTFEYYHDSELRVNQLLSDYLDELHLNYCNGDRQDAKTTAMMICALGNKTHDHDESDGVERWIDEATKLIGHLRQVTESNDPIDPRTTSYTVRSLEYVESVLRSIDVFVTARLGMFAGVEEFAQLPPDFAYPDGEPDFELGVACNKTDTCGCGCSLEHPLRVLQGMEDFLDDLDTPDATYFKSVANSNDIKLDAVAGNEGAVLDAIKDFGTKAYEGVMAGLKSIKEWFTSNSDDGIGEESAAKGEENKKALQQFNKKAAKTKPAAKEGIVKLAKEADPSGEMSKIVGNLNSAADAPRTIDSLLGLLRKHTTGSGLVGAALKEAEAALAALKQAIGKASGDDTNKDVVAAAKAQVGDKVKTAKQKVKDAKGKMAQHNKITLGIRKAVSGISPNVFIADAAPKEE